MPQTNENMEVVWRFMRFQTAIGSHAFGWRLNGNDMIVLATHPSDDDAVTEPKKENPSWTD